MPDDADGGRSPDRSTDSPTDQFDDADETATRSSSRRALLSAAGATAALGTVGSPSVLARSLPANASGSQSGADDPDAATSGTIEVGGHRTYAPAPDGFGRLAMTVDVDGEATVVLTRARDDADPVLSGLASAGEADDIVRVPLADLDAIPAHYTAWLVPPDFATDAQTGLAVGDPAPLDRLESVALDVHRHSSAIEFDDATSGSVSLPDQFVGDRGTVVVEPGITGQAVLVVTPAPSAEPPADELADTVVLGVGVARAYGAVPLDLEHGDSVPGEHRALLIPADVVRESDGLETGAPLPDWATTEALDVDTGALFRSDETPELALVPRTDAIGVGHSTTADLVVGPILEDGLLGATLEVAVESEAVSLTDASMDFELSEATVAEDGSRAVLSGTATGETYDEATSEATIGTVELTGAAVGDATIELEPYETGLLAGEPGREVVLEPSLSEPTVTVEDPCRTVGDLDVCDLNGDGRYRDFDGDGEVTTADVSEFQTNLFDDVVQDNPGSFDFAESDDGSVSHGDVVALFQDATGL